MTSENKKLIIIGAGVSGLSAGIYARRAGYDTHIYEMHTVPGGECTGWDRKGYHIDGCIHWMTGTSKQSPLYKVWCDVGALGEDVRIFETESFGAMETDNGIIRLYKNRDQLESYLKDLAPEDEKELTKFFETIGEMSDFIPPDAMDILGPIESLKILKQAMGGMKTMKKLKMPMNEYLKRFKNENLRALFSLMLPADQSAFVLFFTLSTVMSGNGGRPEGGSRAMALRMTEKFETLGGVLHLGSRVEEICVENGIATGIRISSDRAGAAGDFITADHVLSSTDVHVTLNRFLKGRYPQKAFDMRDADPKTYPCQSCSIAAFGLDLDLSDMDEELIIGTRPFLFEGKDQKHLSLKHYAYEPTFAPTGHSVLTVYFDGNYDWWKQLASDDESGLDAFHLDSPRYLAEKERLLRELIAVLEEKYPEWKGHIVPLDFATPLTYERYCGAYRGQWMSYGYTENARGMMHNGRIKGIKNFSMCGQWLMPPGGLPVAVMTGRWAIQRICKADKKNWRF
jgi:phytoene dehydrogenase-like protein